MQIKKVLSRLGIFFLGIPIILAIVYFSQLHRLALHLLIIFAVITSSLEMHKHLSTKGKLANNVFLAILATVPTLCSYASLWFNFSTIWVFISFVFIAIISTMYEILFPSTNGKDETSEEYFSPSIHALTSNIFLLFYCGLLPTFISFLSQYEFSTAYISTYFILVFSCDSFAWLFGMLFGKNNRGFIKISPNKSIAGFVGGILCTIGMAILCKFIFKVSFEQFPYWGMALLGFGSAILAISGDLVESLIKRSANIKDSGNIILGRGGMLDSIDSLLFVVPFFYLIIKLFVATV